MKVWLKFLIGSILGAICALVLPFENKALFSFLELVTEIVIRFNRWFNFYFDCAYSSYSNYCRKNSRNCITSY